MSKLEEAKKIDSVIQHPIYIILVIFLAIPLAFIISRENLFLGIVLVVLQIPNLVIYFKKLRD